MKNKCVTLIQISHSLFSDGGIPKLRRETKVFQINLRKTQVSIPNKSFNVSKANIPQNIENSPCLLFNVWWDKFCIVRTKVFDVKTKAKATIIFIYKMAFMEEEEENKSPGMRCLWQRKDRGQEPCTGELPASDTLMIMTSMNWLIHVYTDGYWIASQWNTADQMPLPMIKQQSMTSKVTEYNQNFIWSNSTALLSRSQIWQNLGGQVSVRRHVCAVNGKWLLLTVIQMGYGELLGL